MITDPIKVRILIVCDSVSEMRRVIDGFRDVIRMHNPNETVAVLNGTVIFYGRQKVEVILREQLAVKKQGAHWDRIGIGSEVLKRIEAFLNSKGEPYNA